MTREPVHWITLCCVFLTALSASVVLVPPVSRLAAHADIMDRPDSRKVHVTEIPRLGGVAIFFSFVIALLLFADFDRLILGFLAGAVIMFVTGLLDDVVGLTAVQKLAGQSVAASVAVLGGGIHLDGLGDVFGQGDVTLGIFAIPFTIFCVVGVSNAINLMDGLDGLAGGGVAIASGTFVILGYLSGNHPLMYLGCALLGGVLGFLRYNTHPARIFMGDGGSLFLGYCMGIFSVMLVECGESRISGFTPLTVLALPIADTIYVMVRRFREGKKLFAPDRSHLHHRLMGFGLGHGTTVTVLYAVSYALAAFAVVSYRLPDYSQLVALAGLLVLFSIPYGILQTRTWCRFVRSNGNFGVQAKDISILIILLAMANPMQHYLGFTAIPLLLFVLSMTFIKKRNILPMVLALFLLTVSSLI
ncbi:MraY family glycosyltransferase [Geobacter sp.]|uniref:MraY family glycosyltransferase n=1 Tax=Geobacter sp. TaxID=46610 RepID=UPI00262D4C12|nr:MraY family glycosyltransferase [Geobacter sp.]